MKFDAAHYVVLIVEDLERSVKFYQGLLGLPLHHIAPNNMFAEFDTGVTHIALYTRKAMMETLGRNLTAPDKTHPGFELGFKVADVDAAFAEALEKGAKPAVEPTTRFWGQRTAYIHDPDGHLIEFAQDLKPAD